MTSQTTTNNASWSVYMSPYTLSRICITYNIQYIHIHIEISVELNDYTNIAYITLLYAIKCHI